MSFCLSICMDTEEKVRGKKKTIKGGPQKVSVGAIFWKLKSNLIKRSNSPLHYSGVIATCTKNCHACGHEEC
jgi:hypothetical protein